MQPPSINYQALALALLEQLPGPAAIYSESGEVLHANQAARQELARAAGAPPSEWQTYALPGAGSGLRLRMPEPPPRDVLARTRAELQREREQRQRLELIIDALDEGVHLIDHEGTTLVYNRAIALMEDRRVQEVLGRSIFETFPQLTPDTSPLLQVLYSRKGRHSEYQTYWSRHAHKVTTINHTLPVELEGRPAGAVEIAKDVTMIERLYQELARLRGTSRSGLPSRESPNSGAARYTFDDLIGSDPRLLQAVQRARQAAQTASPVLVYGETGTGKEVIVQAIHNASPRREKPFVAVNCAALPEHLLEGILFGTTRGSFTDSVDRPGLFEQANGGTILLDELNSMPRALQAKLTRVLEEYTVRRVGGTTDIPLDIRVCATSGTDPLLAVEMGELRRDLCYRLAVVTLELPPLRERPGDIEPLARYFVDRFNREMRRQVAGLAPEVLAAFKAFDWPGNVRELEHVIEGAINLVPDGQPIRLQDLPPTFGRSLSRPPLTPTPLTSTPLTPSSMAPPPLARSPLAPAAPQSGAGGESLPDRVAESERSLILAKLEGHQGNVSRAARELGIRRQSLQYRMRKYGIVVPRHGA